ncbi:MAG: hypothetical protein IJT12_03530 [Paludibacteraceae bacterium]|nr:hypothetical protein [Paludibacteraceae bacterium]
MPYRRLPNTDQARLRALKTAVQRAAESDFTEQVLPYRLSTEAETCLLKFENTVSQYHTNVDTKVSANKRYKRIVQNTRMYISHFIQVLNFAVIRGEIKKEQKRLYHLDENNFSLPDLSSEDDLLLWGKNIIEGETARMSQGGIPINCPAINKVKVHYDMFTENQLNQSMHRMSTTRVYEDLGALREEADRIILQIWNVVEEHYNKKLPYDRMRSCENYGLKFYYRPHEKRITPETDKEIERAAASQMKLELL